LPFTLNITRKLIEDIALYFICIENAVRIDYYNLAIIENSVRT